jgi:hypothetical protein
MARVWLWCAGVLAWSVVANLGLGDAWYVTRNLLLTVLLLAFGGRGSASPAPGWCQGWASACSARWWSAWSW